MLGVKRNGVTTNGVDHGQTKKRVKYAVEDDEEDEAGESSEEEEEEDDDEDDEDDEEEEEEEDDDEQDLQDPNDLLSKEQKLLALSREISSAIKNDRARAAREGGLEQAREHLEKINAAFAERQKLKSSHKTLEVYDSRNLLDGGDLMDIALRNIKLGTSGGVLNVEEFTRRMKTFLLKTAIQYDNEDDDPENYYDKKHEFRKFNWFQFGTFLYSRGNKAPTTSHLLGPLEIEKKIRQFKARVAEIPVGKQVTAEKVSGDDINGKSINQTPNSVQECFKVFHEKSHGAEINIFKFFINPHSFSQSIENMFFTSFLIRDGRLILGEDEDGYPTIAELPPLPQDPKEREKVLLERRDRPSNHIIFQLEYDSWKNLIEKLNITESYLPHRLEED
ncbi:hypothetical protein WICANDRAFT_78212 [Wickerhamomyces anomalus NRRL Y-366-8]|uniref:Non-structural maintenance of chromosomes element 4 n=1 Tax=Wickerhamomyces anomalus (strain ATCC 58044 / CBS 1984 / NCYC 433 / NRRL Y-366-8) TaxID=683960 RepID=A0A1E3P2Y6_WICAA|nr:uncharacterized protein WICANDRAFT_78212 [Wickerhamomyces anomalus NRRL Y-366-8]ODQ59564.1 hypothetical protein WICANDRAFT_78212 [Wickerhamomyces anomalus NRRL Y-366-8]